ncbi:MAG: helix-turn-helix domain-containing protein [Patescibacteria group bacterium]
MKKTRELERIIKGVANHRRIQIIELLSLESELSVSDVSEKLDVNFKTISEHIRRLAIAGLVVKRSDGTSIRHKLTLRAVTVLKFLRTLE